MPVYVERKVRSAPGLSQEEALDALQSHPNFRPGTKIASFRRRNERWVATLQIPKSAAFPPGEDDEGEDEGPPPKKEAPADDAGDGPEEAPDGPDGPPEGKGKGSTDEAILHVLTEILTALKGGPADPGLGGPDDLGPGAGPDMGPPPPPHGAPGPGAHPGASKLKPGEIPNRPGAMPVGAPAFSSTGQASPLFQRIASVAGRQRHIPVSSPEGMSVKQAKAELDPIAAHFGYHVAQVRYCGPNCSCKTPGSNKIHALLEAS